MFTRIMILFMFAFLAFSAVACTQTTEGTQLVFNPYENVNWGGFLRRSDAHVLAQLHTHTTHSDGRAMPHEVVDFYHQRGYQALAITDHDLVTYPWNFSDLNSNWEDRDPEALGMLAISGNEFSYNHHMAGLFTSYVAAHNEPLETTLEAIDNEEGSLVYFAHPGRYWSVFAEYEDGELYSPSWYLDFFERYDVETLPGIEIFSRNDRHEYDRQLWDILLTEMMPERPIFGLAVDDYHGDDPNVFLHFSYTYHLMADATSIDALRETLISGAFYASHTRQEDDQAPRIDRIDVNERRQTITIKASDAIRIEWVSGVDEFKNSIVVHVGETFDYSNFEGNYVRAVVIKSDSATRRSVSMTQPFGFSQND